MQANDRYMKLGVKTAIDSKVGGGVAIGAVLVDDITGEVIAVGGSQVGPIKDPTAHAEINYIRAATKQRSSR